MYHLWHGWCDQRAVSHVISHLENYLLIQTARSNGRTLSQYAEAASQAQNNVAPSATGGGVLGAPATTPPSTAPTPVETPSAATFTHGNIRWGFLKFDSTEARFVIDQQQVDQHIIELRRQLGNTKSVLGWIRVYNKYMIFFLRNFGGRPAKCEHHGSIASPVDAIVYYLGDCRADRLLSLCIRDAIALPPCAAPRGLHRPYRATEEPALGFLRQY